MKIMTALAASACLLTLLTYTSCTTGGAAGFRSKQDSLKFAKAYFDKYPSENSVKRKIQSEDSIIAKGFGPITWKQVTDYKNNYDKSPAIFSPTGTELDGFTIDSTGYQMILSNKLIKGLYLRFGTKYDGALTLMVLGLDNKGGVIKDSIMNTNQNSNFDNIPICPINCPNNFE